MSEKQIFFKKTIQDIEIKMLRIKDDCYIKIIPTSHKSNTKKSNSGANFLNMMDILNKNSP